jgi:putative SOS response-associated peptidase YedK
MPVILRPEDYEVWIDPDVRERETLTRLLCPYPHAGISAYAVSALVNSPANDDPRCVEPLPGDGR